MTDNDISLNDLMESQPVENGDPSAIDYVGIVGGGVMGRGIAQTFASYGLNVLIVEKDEDCVQRTRNGLNENMDREIQRWAMTEAEKKSILSRIKITTDIEECRNVDFVVEAVDEKFDLKQRLFEKLETVVRPGTICASNSSTLSLTKITRHLKHRENVIGLHFVNPVPKTQLVEIVRALHTSDETFRRTKELMERVGKVPVEVFEYPGFIVTRVLIPMLNEAMHILMEGVASAEDIDKAMRLALNLPMGPLEIADGMGLEEVLAMMEALFHQLGEPRYRPCPLLRKLVREQKFGKKSGEGFFRYDSNGKRIESSNKGDT